MFRPQHLLSWLSFLMALFLHHSRAEVGTAAFYNPPYIPTACYGNDTSQLLENNLFAAAGEGIWDNGASCGRQLLVQRFSAATPRNVCVVGQTIQVRIVDRAATSGSRPSVSGTTIVLSVNAFRMIANVPPTEMANDLLPIAWE
ncbi:EG45-like domain containing protein [Magnolia sinica]|uniref:EG45-like domain containing protein n=1 Tax=Magnolia sinica TaxID=86752 RepID=UPI0026593173|nr:EG45-like domain containing protein [Magnolia sinica]